MKRDRRARQKTIFSSLLAITLAASSLGSAAAGFRFVALGDTAYNGERDYPVYEALIDRINARQPAFSIHVGDIWGARQLQRRALRSHRRLLRPLRPSAHLHARRQRMDGL